VIRQAIQDAVSRPKPQPGTIGGVLVVSPCVMAELDCLVATRKGVDAERAIHAELAA